MKTKTILFLTSAVILLMANISFSAGWSDNFNAGAEQDWGYVDNGDNSTWGVVGNEFQIHTESLDSQTEGVVCYPNYSGTNCCIESRIKRINEGDKYLATVGLRGNAADQNCYSFVISSESNSQVWIIKTTNNGPDFLFGSPLPLGATFDPTNCVVKFQAEGDLLSAKVWTYGTSEPSDWQINKTDSSFKSGTAGIGVSTSAGLGFYNAQVAFDDVVFTTDSVSPEITEFSLGSNSSDHYLFLFDIDQVKPCCHLDGLWIEPGQLSSSTSTPPAYTGSFGTIARTFNSTCDGDQENSYGNLMLSIDASSWTAFYDEISHLKENMPFNENAVIFGKWGGNEGPINKNNINLRGIPVGTSVSFTVKMNNEIPHALAVMGGSMPNVSYDESGFSGAGELTIITTTCRPTSNNDWTPDDSTVGFLIFTDPAYGNEHIGLIAQANHWAGDCFILLPGYDYEAPIDAGDMGVSNAKAGVTMIGQTGDTRDINIFFPDRAIGDVFGPGINENKIMAFVNNNPNYKATITHDVTNFELPGTLSEFQCTFNSPVAVTFGVPATLMISAGPFLIADFGDGRGLYSNNGTGWYKLTGWGDVHDMLAWDGKLVVDFGRGRGMHYFDPLDGQWHDLTGLDTTADMLVWNDGSSEKLVVDFGQGRGLYCFGNSWTQLTEWDNVSKMLVWDNKLVVDFGNGRGLQVHNGSAWTELTEWDDVLNMLVRDGKLVVDFGNGHGLQEYNGAWNKLIGWDNALNMLTRGNNLIVDFGPGRGLYEYSGTWNKLTSWNNIANMLAWNDGSTDNLVVDFGAGRGLYKYNGPWNKLTGWDTAEQYLPWGTKLVVDFGADRGLYTYDTAWSKLTDWDDAIKIMNWNNDLAIDFGPGRGLYRNNTTSWNSLTVWSTAD